MPAASRASHGRPSTVGARRYGSNVSLARSRVARTAPSCVKLLHQEPLADHTPAVSERRIVISLHGMLGG